MPPDTTHDRILAVARDIFYRKGLAGARMQEIADAAGLNKAMLHYHFKTKEQLFDTVFQQALGEFLGGITHVLASQRPVREKISDYVDYTSEALRAQPAVALFILHELRQHPDRLAKQFAHHALADLHVFREQLAAEKGSASRPAAAADQLFVDMVALCVYPFLAQPLLQTLLQQSDSQYQDFLSERKQFIKASLLARI
ncbi:MAG: TetR/AcrR family transcriptional regulator [Janthinobacterium lividum]